MHPRISSYPHHFSSVSDVPKLVEDYLNKDLLVDEFITHELPLSKINEAFDLMHKGESIRAIIKY